VEAVAGKPSDEDYSQVFWISVMMLAFCGAGDTISSILRSTINQMSTPDELRGRMSSINSIFTSSGPQLGQFEFGLLAAGWGRNCRH
jgi:MFS family permease